MVMHGDQCPVGDNSGNAECIGSWDLASDQVLDGCGVEELDVWKFEDLGHEGGHEESLGRSAHCSDEVCINLQRA